MAQRREGRGILACILLATWLSGAILLRSIAASNLNAEQASSTRVGASSTPWEITFFLAHWATLGLAVSLAIAIGFAIYGTVTDRYPQGLFLPVLSGWWLIAAIWSYLTLSAGFRGAADVMPQKASLQSGVVVAYTLLIVIGCLILTCIEFIVAAAIRRRRERREVTGAPRGDRAEDL